MAVQTNPPVAGNGDVDTTETREWLDSLDSVVQTEGPDRARYLLTQLKNEAHRQGVSLPFTANTSYINTIPTSEQPAFPGNRDLERRIKGLMRWNAMAMVVKANHKDGTLGGHISTFASSATLYEIGQNHFFKGREAPGGGDQVYFQGHASPGMYARAFLEGRLSEKLLDNFRQELTPPPRPSPAEGGGSKNALPPGGGGSGWGGGLSSYP